MPNLILGVFLLFVSSISQAAIFGSDSRLDLYEIQNQQILELAKSTVAIVSTEPMWVDRKLVTWMPTNPKRDYVPVSRMTFDPKAAEYTLNPLFLKDFDAIDPAAHKLCSSERFVEQLSISHCSGALIAPDLVLTAGHCVADEGVCKTTQIVFGFDVAKSGDVGNSKIPKKDVYTCSKILRVSAPKPFDKKFTDYAIIQLDRPVEGRKPLVFDKNPNFHVGQKLFTLGHPEGLPTKYSDGEVIYINSAPEYAWLLDTSVTAFAGNSGSPVFDQGTHEIVGVLEGGSNDFKLDSTGSCLESIIYPKDDLVKNGYVKYRTMVTKTSAIDFTGVQE